MEKTDWEKYFGDVGLEPPLPANIEEILNEPCSFWLGKKVKETHILVLIPNRVNGEPFTLNYLGELVKDPMSGYATKYGYYSDYTKEAIGDKSYPSHWVLMTRDVVLDSRGKGYSNGCGMIANHSSKTGKFYELPYELDATAGILMHYVKTGDRLYSDTMRVFTYSRDVGKDGSPLAVGAFDLDGLCVTYSSDNSSGYVGVAGSRVLR